MTPSALLASVTRWISEASAGQFGAVFAILTLASAWLLFRGFVLLQRSRLITDMPTSKIRSAAQGYVELEGFARMMPGEPVLAPLSGQPCAWYRYLVEQRDKNPDGRLREWRTVESGVSEAIFHLQDDTGRCIVDPDGADVTPLTTLRWRGHARRPGFPPKERGFWAQLLASGPYRYTEHLIGENDRLYIIGQFTGLREEATASLRQHTGDLLSLWKKDRPGLLRRFDRNGDGNIDLDEWETARCAAEHEVVSALHERMRHPEQNLMRKPPYGQPFLISCVPQDELVARYRGRALLSIFAFVLVVVMLSWCAKLRVERLNQPLQLHTAGAPDSKTSANC